MDSSPRWYKERSVTTPHRYNERMISLVRRYGGVDSLPPLPSCRDRHKRAFFIKNDSEGSFTKEVWDASELQRTLNPTELRE